MLEKTKSTKAIKKEDSKNYLAAVVNRAIYANRKLQEIPEKRYYEKNDMYWRVIERRNEYLIQCIDIMRNEYGIEIPKPRIHQKDCKYVFLMVAQVLREEKRKRETV